MNNHLHTLNEEGLVVLDDFVAATTCRKILQELEFSHWGDSAVVKYNGDELSPAYFSDTRSSQTSGQVWFSDELNGYLAGIEEKLAALLRTKTNRFEEWQATRYGKDDKFDYHVDCGNWHNTAAGERKRTFLLYLEAPAKGGETHFRALNRTILPRRGRMVVWNNLLPNGNCNFGMIHAGLPVVKGRKTILVSWERQKKLRTAPSVSH